MELEDGSIVINVRNQNNYHCRCRIIVRSLDGGESLPVEELVFDKTLIDPVVAAGALQKQGVMYFTNPSNSQHSEEKSYLEISKLNLYGTLISGGFFCTGVNLTLRWSFTDGKSWEKEAVQIWAGPSGYSTMTSFKGDSPEDNKYIFVVYEKGHKDYWETISFAKIHLYGGK